MRFLATALPGVIVIEPDVYRDPRGWFLETYHITKYQDGGIPGNFVQDNCSSSIKNTLRGLHSQVGRPQGKLIRVVRGRIFDVAVDIRRGSSTFLSWVSVELDGESFRQVYIPPGFAHGFCVLSEVAEVEYKCTDFYYPQGEMSLRWDDPAIGITWPITNPLLSQKDQSALCVGEVMNQLPTGDSCPR